MVKPKQTVETVTQLLESAAAAAPETPALIYGGTALTFASLAAQARRAVWHRWGSSLATGSPSGCPTRRPM